MRVEAHAPQGTVFLEVQAMVSPGGNGADAAGLYEYRRGSARKSPVAQLTEVIVSRGPQGTILHQAQGMINTGGNRLHVLGRNDLGGFLHQIKFLAELPVEVASAPDHLQILPACGLFPVVEFGHLCGRKDPVVQAKIIEETDKALVENAGGGILVHVVLVLPEHQGSPITYD